LVDSLALFWGISLLCFACPFPPPHTLSLSSLSLSLFHPSRLFFFFSDALPAEEEEEEERLS